MALTFTPATVGGKITATIIAQLQSGMSVRTPYTPTVVGFGSSSVAPTITAAWWRTGNIANVLIQGKLGTGTITVNNTTFSLPVPMDTTGMILGSTFLDGSSSFTDVSAGVSGVFAGAIRVVDANTIMPMRPSTTTSGVVGSTSASTPFTWATLDEMSASFWYPIA